MHWKLRETETQLRRNWGTYDRVLFTVGGELLLTNQRLMFEPNFSIISRCIEIDLEAIRLVRTEKSLFNDELIVKVRGAKEYRFQVPDAEIWKDQIEHPTIESERTKRGDLDSTGDVSEIEMNGRPESKNIPDSKLPCDESKAGCSSGVQDQASVIPEHVRAQLKKFDNYENATCLECGYDGKVGVKESLVPWYASWWFIIVLVGGLATFSSEVFRFFGFLSALIVGLVFGLMRVAVSRKICVCPNCEQEIELH